MAVYTLRRVGVRLGPVLPDLVRPAVAAVVAGAVMFALERLTSSGPALVQLVVAGGPGMVIFGLIVVPGGTLKKLVTRSA
jgi:PST family polysaccharide transporter